MDGGHSAADDGPHMRSSFRFGLLLGLAAAAPAQSPTFAEHVAPLLHRHCAPCHRPGEAAPFPLLQYEDAKKRAQMLADVVEDRFMPPWHAAPGKHRFVDERRLTDQEIRLLRAWADAGAPKGPEDKLPTPPEFPAGWQLGEPDLVLTMKKAFEVPAGGADIYRNFLLELDLPEDRWVRAIELRPSARKVVHHSLFFVDTSGEARRLDGRDGRAGFSSMRFAGGQRSERASDGPLAGWGQLGGWAVGMTPRFLPDGLAMHLPAGADIVLQTHFHPSGKAESEQSSIGIWFGEKPERSLAGIQLPPFFGALWGIDIPPGEKRYEVRDSFVLPVDVDAISIGGHAHYLCTDLRATAITPEGEEVLLLDVPRWDFNWQDRYAYASAPRLAAGTKLEFVLHYDNSDENPFNPHDPPRRVRFGRESEDEMGSLTLQVACAEERDLPKLQRAIREHTIGSSRTRIAETTKRRVLAYDKDGDGKVVISDLPRAWRRIAERTDRNQDGILDDDEMNDFDVGELLRRR